MIGLRSVPLRVGAFSWLVPLRAALVTVAGFGVLGVLIVLDVAHGDIDIPLGETVAALAGRGDPARTLVIRELRLPQAGVAALAGAALGLAGALTQTLARNPLASPDILGVTRGAALAAVAVIALSGGGDRLGGVLRSLGVPVAAFAGAALTALLLWLLAWRRGLDTRRLVLIGIGTGASLTAATHWLLARASIDDVASAHLWLNGSLDGAERAQLLPLAVALAAVAPFALWLVRHLNVLQLGDGPARGLGARPQRVQALTLLAAVVLSAVSVSAVGPLDFVAFVVPQVALRLTGGSRPPLLASAVYGACLVVAADLVTRVVLPFAVPAGLVTTALGAPYLIWLLYRLNGRGRRYA